jgi:uncharacterized damage-inducible protein DinB
VSHFRRRHFRTLLLPSALSIAALTPARSAFAQDTAGVKLDVKSAARIRDHYLADVDTLHRKVVALANAIPAEKYSWRPAAGVRSISEVLMHITSEWYFWGPRSIGGGPPADYGVPKDKNAALEKITSKPDVLAELDKSWIYYKAQLTAAKPATLTGKYPPWGMTLEEAAFGMTDDLHEHLGQLIAYARSVGVKPPWTK